MTKQTDLKARIDRVMERLREKRRDKIRQAFSAIHLQYLTMYLCDGNGPPKWLLDEWEVERMRLYGEAITGQCTCVESLALLAPVLKKEG